MYKWTEEQVLQAVRDSGFDEPCCLDMLEDARCEETLEEAAQVIILDSAYWNGTF